MPRTTFRTPLLACLSAEGPQGTDAKQQITVTRATSQTANGDLSERERHHWPRNPGSRIYLLHVKFPCLPSAGFPPAASAVRSVGPLSRSAFAHAFRDRTRSAEPRVTSAGSRLTSWTLRSEGSKHGLSAAQLAVSRGQISRSQP